MGTVIYTNDGTAITYSGTVITCSNGENYMYSGRILIGPRGTMSMNVGSIQEAVGIVAGMHGGRKF